MLKFFKKFLADSRGNIAITAGILMVPLLGASGLAVDYTMLTQKRSKLQAAADAAALSSVKELGLVNTADATVETIATNYVHANLSSGSVRQLSINVSIARNRKEVEVRLEEVWQPFMLQFLNDSVMPIKVSSAASLAGSESLCVIALDRQSANSLAMTGASTLAANGCAIYSNSKSSKGIAIVRGAKMSASSTYSAGGYLGPSNGFYPKPNTDSSQIADPLIDRAQPQVGGCKFRNTVVKRGHKIFYPGTYCGGMLLAGRSHTFLKPGTYIMKDGPLVVSGDATLTGENVGFFFEGDRSVFNFGTSTQINLTAPKTGKMAGMLFFESRNSPPNRTFLIKSKDAEQFEGTVYLPKGRFVVDKESRVGHLARWTAIVANQIEIRRGPNLQINSDYSFSSIPVPEGIAPASGSARLIR